MYGVYHVSMEQRFTISQIAKAAGIGVETIRFYQRQKLLETPSKKVGSIRHYDQDHLEKIVFIKKAQSVGFTLAEIKELLRLRLSPNSDCTPIKKKTQVKINEVEQKIEDLNKILKALKTFESRCDTKETTGKCSILDGIKELPNG